MKRSIKDYVGILLAGGSVWAFLLYFIYQTYSQNLPVETYLLSGGLDLVTIPKGQLGVPDMSSIRFTSYASNDIEWHGKAEKDGVRLMGTWTEESEFVLKEDPPPQLIYFLKPSREKEGDWDLWELKGSFCKLVKCGPSNPDWKQPARSYFHRVDDERIQEYFSILESSKDVSTTPAQRAFLRDIAEALVEALPEDLYIRTLLLDALIRCRDWNGLDEKFSKWEGDYAKADEQLQKIFAWSRRIAEVGRKTDEGKNALPFLQEIMNRKQDLHLYNEQLKEVAKYEILSCTTALIPLLDPIPNYLKIQTRMKVCVALSTIDLMSGNRIRARESLIANLLAASMENADLMPVGKLVGAACSGISAHGLLFVVTNGCESPEDALALKEQLDLIDERNIKVNEDDPVLGEIGTPAGCIVKQRREVWTRLSVAEAEFENLRTIAGAKVFHQSNGRFPSTPEEMNSRYKKTPTDPFTKQPVLFSASAETFKAYCVGPDNSDGGGNPEYDPTNGVISAGDITMTLPRSPEFNIPKEGLRAVNAEDLRNQFPNGLPRDPFRECGTGSLSISGTDVPYIYSYGPDNQDSWVIGKDDKGRPLYRKDPILYDPTNGTTSIGDIIAAIPAP